MWKGANIDKRNVSVINYVDELARLTTLLYSQCRMARQAMSAGSWLIVVTCLWSSVRNKKKRRKQILREWLDYTLSLGFAVFRPVLHILVMMISEQTRCSPVNIPAFPLLTVFYGPLLRVSIYVLTFFEPKRVFLRRRISFHALSLSPTTHTRKSPTLREERKGEMRCVSAHRYQYPCHVEPHCDIDATVFNCC